MPVNVDYIFSVLLKREIARESDKIAERVEKMVDEHFELQPRKLKTTQINRFTGIAYSSDDTGGLKRFIEQQVAKTGEEAKGWKDKGLEKKLIDRIREIKTANSEQAYKEALKKTEGSVGKEAAEEFDREHRGELIHEISIQLLRKFATHFGIHYLYRGG